MEDKLNPTEIRPFPIVLGASFTSGFGLISMSMMVVLIKNGNPMHIAPACIGFREVTNHFETVSRT
jgi:hypothetical protein